MHSFLRHYVDTLCLETALLVKTSHRWIEGASRLRAPFLPDGLYYRTFDRVDSLKLQDWTLRDEQNTRLDIAGLDNDGLDSDGLDSDAILRSIQSFVLQ